MMATHTSMALGLWHFTRVTRESANFWRTLRAGALGALWTLGVLALAASCAEQAPPKDSIFTRCPDQIENIYAACDYMRNSSADPGVYDTFGCKNFALLMFSDTHEDRVRTANAIELLEGCKAIDAAVFLGDFQYWRYEQGWANDFADMVSGASKPLMLTVGNHDARCLSAKEHGTNMDVLVREYIMRSKEAPFYTPGGYGYRDFADYGVRLIILNDFEYPEETLPGDTKGDQKEGPKGDPNGDPKVDSKGDSKGDFKGGPNGGKWVISGSQKVMTQQQIDWFIRTLESTPEGYTVIVGQHLNEPMTIDLDACSPHRECPNVKIGDSLVCGKTGLNGGPIISDILNAFIHRTEIHNRYESQVQALYASGSFAGDTGPGDVKPSGDAGGSGDSGAAGTSGGSGDSGDAGTSGGSGDSGSAGTSWGSGDSGSAGTSWGSGGYGGSGGSGSAGAAGFPDPAKYPAVLRADGDFTLSKADFACTIAGHVHNNLVGHNAKYPDQVVFVNDAASCPRIVNDGSSVSQYSTFARNADGPSQDLLTVLCLDKVNRRLNFVRIGAHIDLLLEDHSLLSYPY